MLLLINHRSLVKAIMDAEPEKRADSFNAGMIWEDDIIIMTSGLNWRLL